MRVILTQSVPKLGDVGDVCDVAPGYGRNFLLPQGMAVVATRGALRQVEDLRRTEARRLEGMRSDIELLAGRIEAIPLTFTAKVGETGRFYGAITSSDIADQLEEALGEPVDRRKIMLDEPIKSLGPHKVPLHLMAGVNAMIDVTVVADAEVMEDIGLRSSTEDDEHAEDVSAEASQDEGVPENDAGDDESDEGGDEEPPEGDD
jgi:large subunit ribosomal protein L9